MIYIQVTSHNTFSSDIYTVHPSGPDDLVPFKEMFVTRNFVFYLTIAIVSAENVNWNGNSASKCDFSGINDFNSVRSEDQECQNICLATYGCTHYVWSLIGNGTCFLKHDPYITKDDAYVSSVESAVCGIVATTVEWHGESWALRCDFPPKDDFRSVPSVKEECQRICSSTELCTHYTWSLNGGGTCYLKHNTNISKDMAYKSQSKSAICGIVNKATE